MSIGRRVRPLFPELGGRGEGETESSLLVSLLKASGDGVADPSRQGVDIGEQQRPYKMGEMKQLVIHNPHHSTCVQAKVKSTLGFGHSNDQVAKKLNPLCMVSWQNTLDQIGQDFEGTGNGYLEVVREKGAKDSTSEITGLYYMPAEDVDIVIENARYDVHYELNARTGARNTNVARRKFAKFGDLKGFLERHNRRGARRRGRPRKDDTSTQVSELIHFQLPSNLHRFFGVVDWFAAIPYIELVSAMVQHQFDFHLNRGVPEFMLFVLGAKIDKKQWKKIDDAIDATIGPGNNHKSLAVNIGNQNVKVQLEKLAMEGTQDGAFFKDMMETLALSIVSAHRVPPSIAGILIPGKMGASNEMSNALVAFQALVVGPRQNIFETILGCTLGNEAFNAGVDLGEDDFTFNKITENMAEAMQMLAPLNTMGGMRQELPEAAAEGRNLNNGLRD